LTYRTNLISGSALSAFSAVYLYFSMGIKPFKGIGATPLDATFIPRFWGVCLLILSLTLVARGLRERADARKSAEASAGGARSPGAFVRRNYEVILTFLSILVYTALLGPVGFIVMSALYIFFQALILTPKAKRNPKAAALIAVVAAVSIDFLFVRLLSVLLPKGIIGF